VIILGSLSHFRGILSILRYNFVDVPKDQYWLFGSAPANAPASLADLFIDPWFWVPLAVTFIFFLAALLATLLLPAKSLAQLPTAGLAMALYALATFTPYLSRYNAEYAQPAIRICSIYLVLILAQFTPIKPALHIVTAVLIIWFATLRPNVLDIASLISRLPAHSKVIVWAATVHLAKDLSVVPGHEGYVTMGPLIYRDFNSQSFVLGFSAYSGTYAPVTHPAQQLSAAPNNSLEGQAFANNNSDTHYMNSEQIRKLGPVPARPLGSEFRTARWDQVVDGILLFRTEHPPTLVQP
jgi:hypothetical protein